MSSTTPHHNRLHRNHFKNGMFPYLSHTFLTSRQRYVWTSDKRRRNHRIHSHHTSYPPKKKGTCSENPPKHHRFGPITYRLNRETNCRFSHDKTPWNHLYFMVNWAHEFPWWEDHPYHENPPRGQCQSTFWSPRPGRKRWRSRCRADPGFWPEGFFFCVGNLKIKASELIKTTCLLANMYVCIQYIYNMYTIIYHHI